MRFSYLYIIPILIGGTILFNACQQETSPLPNKIDFNFHIRPILSENCFLCHGPDISSREADLRLDLEATAKAVLDNGKRPIHAGKWSESEIRRRVTSDDPDLQMPPPEMNKRLSKREIALLEKWMEQGAKWKEYWAFIPPELPTDKAFSTLANTSKKIDYLVDKSLTENGLSKTEKASKSALVRRLSYLLTGLPPTPEIIEQPATNNQQPATSNQQPATSNQQPATSNQQLAYEELVDQYLDSPHFGERWARHWMDLVRYAEYKGHEFDYPVIGAWQYRDYLIRAFNADVPYNQFIKEQLAGDLLEQPRMHPENGTNESIHGTQIFTFSENKHSPVSIKQEEADVFDNMIDVTTKTFQGLTVACARCHDHKFDAIPTTDYYSLYGIFESTRFALIPSGTSLDAFATVDSIEAIRLKMKEILGEGLVGNEELSSNPQNTSPQWHRSFSSQEKLNAPKGEKTRANEKALSFNENTLNISPNFDKSNLQELSKNVQIPRAKNKTSLVLENDKISKNAQNLKVMNRVFPPLEGARGRKKQVDNSYQKVLTKSPAEPSTKATIIADFRDGTLNNWASNGIAFNNQNALGTPIFDKKGKFIKLETAKVSSRILGTGIQGALRSPTFMIENKKLVVRAAGENAMIRLIVDNFQLIQNPIYGGLEREVKEGKMQEYVLDLAMVQGHKAYLELLPGQKTNKGGKGHYYEFKPNAWIEAKYAIAYDGETIPTAPPITQNFVASNKTAAYQNWVNETANPKEIDLLNQELQKGKWRPARKQLSKLNQQANQLAQSLYDSTFFQGVTEGDAQLSRVFIRGNRTTLSDEKVPHQFFDALKDYSPEFSAKGSGRKELAEGIASPKNPLTARVMVNRIWHHLFGKGIVETVDNFGLQGKTPTHPELLDYLALQFVEDGWSIKKLIKNIVLTETFQRSTIPTKKAVKNDPQNLYLSHFPLRRLEGEAIRDGLLAVSGRLDKTLYGEPFEIYLTDFIKGRGRPRNSGTLDGEGRRSIYQTIRRNFLPPFMLTFDMPAPFSTFGKRNESNVPAQSLTMMNDPFVQEQAKVWATHISEEPLSFEERVVAIYLNAFSRIPTPTEVAEAQDFFKEQAEIYETTNADALEDIRVWTDYCHTIFMMKEFIYLTG